MTAVLALVCAKRIALLSDAMSAAGMPDGRYGVGSLEVSVVDGAADWRQRGQRSDRMRQVLVNLLWNAARHTPPGPARSAAPALSSAGTGHRSAHDGDLTLKSRPGSTTFALLMPVTASVAAVPVP